MAIDTQRIARAVREILSASGEDPSRAGLVDTPERVAEAFAEYFAGLGRDPLEALGDTMPMEPGSSDLVVVRDLDFRSTCEHHLVPFVGVAHVAYLPHDRIVGLGRIPRLIETLASRPQLQERLTDEIADALQAGLGARGVLVVLDATHLCVAARGPRQTRSTTLTVAARGSLAEPAGRAEALSLIALGGSRPAAGGAERR